MWQHIASNDYTRQERLDAAAKSEWLNPTEVYASVTLSVLWDGQWALACCSHLGAQAGGGTI